jgi:hypothetical protein
MVVGTAINEIVNNLGTFPPGKNTELGFFRYFYGRGIAPKAPQPLVSRDGTGSSWGRPAARRRTFRAVKL